MGIKEFIKSNCFFTHKWSKWEQYEQPYKRQHELTFDYRQKRKCIKCGKVQDELIY
jgi:hypothetical protein